MMKLIAIQDSPRASKLTNIKSSTTCQPIAAWFCDRGTPKDIDCTIRRHHPKTENVPVKIKYLSELGHGSFGRVFLVEVSENTPNGIIKNKMALKLMDILNFSQATKDAERYIDSEFTVTEKIKSPYIIHSSGYAFFDNPILNKHQYALILLERMDHSFSESEQL